MGWLEKLLLLLLAFLLMALGGWITMQWSSMQDLDSFQAFTQLGTLVVLLATLLVLYQTLQSNKRDEQRKALIDQLHLYYTPEVYEGIKRLWTLYRDCNRDIGLFIKEFSQIISCFVLIPIYLGRHRWGSVTDFIINKCSS